jgi:hypothetical protein
MSGPQALERTLDYVSASSPDAPIQLGVPPTVPLYDTPMSHSVASACSRRVPCWGIHGVMRGTSR